MTTEHEKESSEVNPLAVAIAFRWAESATKNSGTSFSEEDLRVIGGLINGLLEDPLKAEGNITEVLKITGNNLLDSTRPEDVGDSEFNFDKDCMITAIVNADSENIPEYYQSLVRERDRAVELATLIGIEPSLMFIDNELYVQLIRATYSPEGYVTGGLRKLQRLTSNLPFNMKVALRRIEQGPEEPEEAKGMFSEAAKAFAAALYPPTPEEEIDKAIASSVLQLKNGLLKALKERVLEIWGEDGLNSVPKNIFDQV